MEAMEKEFEKKVVNFIRTENLLRDGDRVLAAVSGGADSVALLRVLNKIEKEKIFDIRLLCAHINHQLRGESADRDEQFVVKLAERMKIPVITKSVNVSEFAEKKKLSTETAARKLRIRSLLEIAEENNCNLIATGHHKDDNAETILQRLKRGTGYRGLAGIWSRKKFDENVDIIRPLLCVKREEITEYLEGEKLSRCYDHTNSNVTYERNFIRHLLIPEISKNFSGDLPEKLYYLAENCRKFQLESNRTAEKIWEKHTVKEKNRIRINIDSFSNHNPEIGGELFRIAINRLGGGEQNLKQTHYEQIAQLINKETGKTLDLPSYITVFRDCGQIVFEKGKSRRDARLEGKISKLKIPGTTDFGEFRIKTEILNGGAENIKNRENRNIEYFALDKVKPPLKARKRKKGDRFVPLARKSSKRVSKFLTKQKIRGTDKEKILIICDEEKIIWVCPVRSSEKSRVDKTTKRVLKMVIESPSR